jgi:hypothetical protein
MYFLSRLVSEDVYTNAKIVNQYFYNIKHDINKINQILNDMYFKSNVSKYNISAVINTDENNEGQTHTFKMNNMKVTVSFNSIRIKIRFPTV